MAYQIGDRRFPWFGRFFEDSQAKEPREVSNAPILPVALINPAGATMIVAQGRLSTATLGVATPGNPLLWNFDDNTLAETSQLPSNYRWTIHQVGITTDTALRMHWWYRWKNLPEGSESGILMDAALSAQTSVSIPVSTIPRIPTFAANDQFVFPREMPYGGALYLSSTVPNATVEAYAIATGVWRQLPA